MNPAAEPFAWTVEWANHNHSPIATMMGFRVLEIGRGEAVVEMDYRPAFLELMGMYNSGVLVTLADTAFILAARTVTDPALTLDPDRYPLVVQLSVNLVHNTNHGRVRAHAKVVHRGRTTDVVKTEVTDETGRLLVLVTSTHVTIPRYATAEGPIT